MFIYCIVVYVLLLQTIFPTHFPVLRNTAKTIYMKLTYNGSLKAVGEAERFHSFLQIRFQTGEYFFHREEFGAVHYRVHTSKRQGRVIFFLCMSRDFIEH